MIRTVFACLVASAILNAAEELKPLPIELPKPMFEGTPQNLKAPNLEKPLGKPRPAFLAPAGAVNLAAGKRASSSGEDPTTGELSMITDGEKSGADGSYVELASGTQYVTIDLRKKSGIYAVLLWHYHKQPRVYKSVIVQVANDPDFITDVKTIFNNDFENAAGLGIGKDQNYVETAEGKLIDAKGVECRYVRLYSSGNNVNASNHYVEVEVFGKPLS